MDLDHLLCRPSPYENFEGTPYASGLRWGYGSANDVLGNAIDALRPNIIIEVGSWEGGSATYMGEKVKALGLTTKIICIDTWLGAPEHVLQEGFRGTLELRNGFPTLYYRFMNNMVAAGLQDIVSPLPNTSANAAHILRSLNVRADLIFVDAAHEYEPVMSDLKDYWGLLSDRGVLIGDDYIGWPEVTAAANDFAKKEGARIIGTFGKFMMQKGDVLPLDFMGMTEPN